MTCWWPKLSATRLYRVRPPRATSARWTCRLLAGVLAVTLFGVDTSRSAIGLAAPSRNGSSEQTQVETNTSGQGSPHGRKADAVVAAWSNPWIPPLGQLSPRGLLELAFQAAPSGRTVSLVSSSPAPHAQAVLSETDPYRVQLRSTDRRLIPLVDIPLSCLAWCRQIRPTGPPAA